MYIAVDDQDRIRAVSNKPVDLPGHDCLEVPGKFHRKSAHEMVGKLRTDPTSKSRGDLKVAMFCNWDDQCGISTYSGYLGGALRAQVGELRVFSEHRREGSAGQTDPEWVTRCWKRGENMAEACAQLKAYKPDFVIVQHEYGLFPDARRFLAMLHQIEKFPYVIVMHSTYANHLDKVVCTAACHDILVHSEAAREVLAGLGNTGRIHVVPHGCVKFDDVSENWNIFKTPYAIVQFGFGFFYKGVDIAIDAVHHLKKTDPKFEEIFYLFLCSDNGHNNAIHGNYFRFLQEKIEGLGLQENVSIVRKFQSDEAINNYLRTAKLALFPYTTDPNNTVYGASGAVRIALANGCPAIASPSHLFDDLEGIIPRPQGYLELAQEIDRVFSDGVTRDEILRKGREYIEANTWDKVASRYLDIAESIRSSR